MAVPTANLATFKIPQITNEPMKTYAPGTAERAGLQATLKELRAQAPLDIPCVVNGQEVRTGIVDKQVMPHEHKSVLCTYHNADEALVAKAIDGALAAKKNWANTPFNDRAAIFLKAADLISTKYRYKIMAATMLGQGKNAWQAEIDSAAELIDFFRFGVKFAEELYAVQPAENSAFTWNRTEYRPLEGFVFAVSPFNFTAIGGNLAGAPVLMGNVCVWKPAPAATLSSYIVYDILREAGLPAGVIQFIPGPAPEVVGQVLKHPEFAALHFTGSTHVFRKLWKDIGNNIENYKSYPRIVGETGGKNFHMVHKSANVKSVVQNTIRSSFEYQGQKCSACSRCYYPDNLWPEIKAGLIETHARILQGGVDEFQNFMGPVINQFSFDKIKSYIDWAKSDKESEIIAGGSYDDSVGYFVQPTIIVTTNPKSKTMTEEIFGPVVTIYVYKAEEYEQTLELVANSSMYALTGSLFSQDRYATIVGANALRDAAGNFYINDKSTGAVVGQQPFGGGRASGTNDKAGSAAILSRFVSPRSIKESFVDLEDFVYPSNLV
ncbi:1-pyrroline-5-carboxylate dehydrogenase [Actinomortierella ambigua]|uniref:Multifunctional fusion protein n=1 Tax=Actinomortierella ambigua TaxID=1343610 RepID=A0A9P6QLE2_9FUNG|nr:1-pyrroline-5-carboxylate dehydrogenase [Actinomortierella ambigua]KAG0270220.1 1-pyrroline-5-carboxylate dehydrogenase [Actinomortierella ambigua]